MKLETLPDQPDERLEAAQVSPSVVGIDFRNARAFETDRAQCNGAGKSKVRPRHRGD